MKSLFFVSSPLEMISAIEAREKFNINDNELVLYLLDKDIPIVDYILSLSKPWNKIDRIYRNYDNLGNRWLSYLKKYKKNKYEYLFTTSMPFTAHFLFNINYKSHFFLDDGTLTLTNITYFKKKQNLKNQISLFIAEGKGAFKWKKKEFIYFLKGHRLRGNWKKLSVFTFFDIKVGKNMNIVKNELLWFNGIKKEKKIKVINNTVYIIGSSMPDENIISKEYYFELLSRIQKKFSSKNIYYIPHRWEKEQKILAIKKQFGFTIKPNKSIIEIDFLMQNQIPEIVAGTISTALFTIKKLYPETKVYSTSLDIEKVLDKKTAIESILTYQKNMFLEIKN